MLADPRDRDGFPFALASTTGTAQKIVQGHYVHDQHIASCVGFFPANAPRYVITVVIDSPCTNGETAWGSRYAKPSFKRIAHALYQRQR
jgi:cell division protein FtsI (penicillin-binding protein 3)